MTNCRRDGENWRSCVEELRCDDSGGPDVSAAARRGTGRPSWRQCILDVEKLAELIQERQSETSIAAQLDGHTRESGFQSWHQPQQQRNNASMTGSIAWSQPRRQQAPGVTLEDEHGVVHMLVVSAVENAELLLAMRGIVGGVDIQQDLAALADLFSAEAKELIEQGIVQAHQVAGGRRLLPAAERGLGAESFSQLLIGHDL